MKKLLISTLIIQSAFSSTEYVGSNFNDVWDTISADIYENRPTVKVSTSKFLVKGIDRLSKAAKRTISSREDLLPVFDKLLHPNGTCLKGSWNITESTPYTGYYATGAEGLIIARASVALSDTTQKKYRGFGMAGKIYPTSSELHNGNLKTGNFFVIDDLAGTKEKYYTRAAMTNKPETSVRFSMVGMLGLLIKAGKALGSADSEPGVRQLYEVSELGMEDTSGSITPKWMMILGDSERVSKKDFRDELNVDNYQGALRFGIYVSDRSSKPKKRKSSGWKKIGFIEYNESASSYSCDHRLHFHHPKFRR